MSESFGIKKLNSLFRSKRVLFCVGLCLFLLVVDSMVSALWYGAVMRKVAEHTVRPSEVGVVFMKNFTSQYMGLGDDTIRTLNYTVDLYHRGLIGGVICVGGNRPSRGVSGSVYMKNYLADAGIPENNIITENVSNDTVSNLQQAGKILRDKGFMSVVLVSSPFHILRIRDLIDNFLVGVGDIQFSSYSYEKCVPPVSTFDVYKDIHYEWTATVLGRILPASVFRRIISMLRG